MKVLLVVPSNVECFRGICYKGKECIIRCQQVYLNIVKIIREDCKARGLDPSRIRREDCIEDCLQIS
jgi:hypothetical protein